MYPDIARERINANNQIIMHVWSCKIMKRVHFGPMLYCLAVAYVQQNWNLGSSLSIPKVHEKHKCPYGRGRISGANIAGEPWWGSAYFKCAEPQE